MKISRAVQGFLFHKEAAGCSQNTLASYRRNAEEFAEFVTRFEVEEIEDVTSDHVRRYLYHLRTNRRLADKTVRNHWTVLSSMWSWASVELKVPHIIRDRVACPKAQPPDIVPLTKDEIIRLLDATERAKRYKTDRRRAVRRSRPEASRDKAIILTLLDTGLRVSELCNLTRSDVDLARGAVFVGDGKHRLSTKSRHVYLGTSAKKAVWDYLADREEELEREISKDEPLFAATDWKRSMNRHSVRRMLYRCADRAGVKDVYPHRFRHTFAITYLRNGGDPFTLQAILGHSSLDMVKVYVRIAQQDCEETHRRASPADNWHL